MSISALSLFYKYTYSVVRQISNSCLISFYIRNHLLGNLKRICEIPFPKIPNHPIYFCSAGLKLLRLCHQRIFSISHIWLKSSIYCSQSKFIFSFMPMRQLLNRNLRFRIFTCDFVHVSEYLRISIKLEWIEWSKFWEIMNFIKSASTIFFHLYRQLHNFGGITKNTFGLK